MKFETKLLREIKHFYRKIYPESYVVNDRIAFKPTHLPHWGGHFGCWGDYMSMINDFC